MCVWAVSVRVPVCVCVAVSFVCVPHTHTQAHAYIRLCVCVCVCVGVCVPVSECMVTSVQVRFEYIHHYTARNWKCCESWGGILQCLGSGVEEYIEEPEPH